MAAVRIKMVVLRRKGKTFLINQGPMSRIEVTYEARSQICEK
jgi:hypothetical protein